MLAQIAAETGAKPGKPAAGASTSWGQARPEDIDADSRR
jgi:hypothetical protein